MNTSIVVPVYNDPDGLSTTVESLLDQTASDYEVVIADNGSADTTPAVARRLSEADDRVRVVRETAVQSSYAARNAGIAATTGDVIGFLDADMWVDRDYVEAITRSIAETDRSYLGCDVEVVGGGGSVSRFYQAVEFPVERLLRDARFAPTCCLVVHRRVIEAVGPFDDRLISGGDVEFGRRVADHGFALAFEPSITVYHPERSSIRELVSKHIRVGRGQEQLRTYHTDRITFRPIAHPGNYLPLRPRNFLAALNDTPVSPWETGYWFLLAYLLKLSRSVGRLLEYGRQRLATTGGYSRA